MAPYTHCTAVIALIISMALPVWGQQYLLYVPQPVPSGQKALSQDGILVQEIEIRKGDTLYDLSRKFSGRGMYFPQILLFNSIKNPNLIYPGNTLKIPVTQKGALDSDRVDTKATGASHKIKASGDKKTLLKTKVQPAVQRSSSSPSAAVPSTELSLSDLKTAGAEKSKARRYKKKTVVSAKKVQSHVPPVAAMPSTTPLPAAHKSIVEDDVAAQKLFETAVKAYRQDDCSTALEQLDRFLAKNPDSPLAADANLYKAECYLKLSAQ